MESEGFHEYHLSGPVDGEGAYVATLGGDKYSPMTYIAVVEYAADEPPEVPTLSKRGPYYITRESNSPNINEKEIKGKEKERDQRTPNATGKDGPQRDSPRSANEDQGHSPRSESSAALASSTIDKDLLDNQAIIVLPPLPALYCFNLICIL